MPTSVLAAAADYLFLLLLFWFIFNGISDWIAISIALNCSCWSSSANTDSTLFSTEILAFACELCLTGPTCKSICDDNATVALLCCCRWWWWWRGKHRKLIPIEAPDNGLTTVIAYHFHSLPTPPPMMMMMSVLLLPLFILRAKYFNNIV